MATPNYFEHKTIDGDRWDLLAYQYYGDIQKQSVLIEANRSLFLNPVRVPPLILPSGLTLKIPVIEQEKVDADSLPPWKRTNPTYEVDRS